MMSLLSAPGFMPPPPAPGPYPPPPHGAGPRPSMPSTPIPPHAHAHPYYHQSPQRKFLLYLYFTNISSNACHSSTCRPVSDDDGSSTSRCCPWCPSSIRSSTCTTRPNGRRQPRLRPMRLTGGYVTRCESQV